MCLYLSNIHVIQTFSGDSATKEERPFKSHYSNSNGFRESRDLKNATAKKESVKQDETDAMTIQTRLAMLEKTQNDLIKSLSEFIQTSTENQNKVMETFANIDTQLKEAAVKFETIENEIKSLNAKIDYFENAKCPKQASSNQLREDIKIIKQVASLLAITLIKYEDFPYTMQCEKDQNTGEVGSRMDLCIQTRLDEVFHKFEDLLDFHVMLVNGSGPHEGRVEIIYRGVHGTVCVRHWDIKDAKVVCKMLGYKGARRAYNYKRFGSGTGEIFLDEVACTGREGSLLGCRHRGIGGERGVSGFCDHDDDAGVTCRT